MKYIEFTCPECGNKIAVHMLGFKKEGDVILYCYCNICLQNRRVETSVEQLIDFCTQDMEVDDEEEK